MPSLIDFSCTDLAVGLESSATNNRRSGVLRARNLHENNYSSTMVIPRAFEIRDVIYWVFFNIFSIYNNKYVMIHSGLFVLNDRNYVTAESAFEYHFTNAPIVIILTQPKEQ